MMVCIDAKTWQVAPPDNFGVIGFVSWERLAEMLRANGDVKGDEELRQIEADSHGLTLWFSLVQGP